MDQINGLISLLLACIEVLFVINLLIFSKKRGSDIIIILLVSALAAYQIFEFLLCYFEIYNAFLVYSVFALLGIVPPLSLLLSFELAGIGGGYRYLIFLPVLGLTAYYSTIIDAFSLTGCTVFYAVYNYPLGTLYGIFYYSTAFLSIVYILKCYLREGKSKYRRNLLVLLIGYILTFMPVIVIFFIFPFLIDAVESILCKMAFIFAVSLTYFSLGGRSEWGGAA